MSSDAKADAIRTGDIVRHASGEEWVVAWADYSTGDMAPCGWPECQARIADCTLSKRASDTECAELAASLAASGRRDAHRATAILTQEKPHG